MKISLKPLAISAALTALGILGGLPGVAHAGAIYSPVSGTIDIGGPGFGAFGNTFDQTGLSAAFVSGVSDFDTVLAANPTHDFQFVAGEWFSDFGLTSASVTYDLGEVLDVSRLALWNEDSAGIGTLDLYSSADGITFSALSLGLSPTDNLLNLDYTADVFAFTTTAARYIRFDMSGCLTEIDFQACSIGEVAFDATPITTAIPEPSTYALMIGGLALVAASARRRRA